MRVLKKLQTFSPGEGEVPVREADEVELREGHAGHEVHALRVLPLVHQLLVRVCVCGRRKYK